MIENVPLWDPSIYAQKREKFDWISVVLSGLVFFTLAAWLEFAFFELRYPLSSKELSDKDFPELEENENENIAGNSNDKTKDLIKKEAKRLRLLYAVGLTLFSILIITVYNHIKKK
jgi:hypothetical protein